MTKKVLAAMNPIAVHKAFRLPLCSLTISPVDSTGLKQRKTGRWNGVTLIIALIGGRSDEQVSRPQAR
ncbi:MAG: hypothetical protein E6I80_19760 [Chloroflexi bacterium]|nr:MAG: hypothetical protein E6I80_19760 [Chloroflexota bacterium]